MNNAHDFSQRLNAIIETAIDGIITIDNRGMIETVNHAVLSLFQYERKELLKNNISMLMPEPYHSQHDRYLSTYIKTRQAKIIGIGREVKGRKKDGTIFPFRLAVSEVVLNDRIIFTGIVHDLSDTKQAQIELEKLNNRLEEKIAERTDELEAAINRLIQTNQKLEKSEEALTEALQTEKQTNELKSRFITTASHEFRTPLSTILSSASLISRYELTEQQPNRLKHVEKIKNSVNHLTGILNDFLDLSKLEEGKVKLNFEPIPLSNLVLNTFSELKGLLKEGQKFELTTTENFLFETDKQTLKNILFNLLSNAVKYSAEGIIKVAIFDRANDVEIQIEDKGKGIPKVDQPFLFERFFRASNASNIQGTGLGLSIVLRYLDLLNGQISFESEEGKGTTFVLQIPKVAKKATR